MKKNFYVDDCLKSLPSVAVAIAHVHDLQDLLSKGGFKLTKCDPSRKKGAYPNFTLRLFHSHGCEIVKNYWNVSEISLSRREKGHSHRENRS